MKGLWEKIVMWWQNQKYVLLRWLPTMIDGVLQPLLQREIEQRKQEIINSLNTFSARENSIKACAWIKSKLAGLLPK